MAKEKNVRQRRLLCLARLKTVPINFGRDVERLGRSLRVERCAHRLAWSSPVPFPLNPFPWG